MYHHLKNFTESGSQKVMYIFTYANIVGVFLGYLAASYLISLLPFVPGFIGYPACMVTGLVLTWSTKGRMVYSVVLLWLSYLARKVLIPQSLIIYSGDYYKQTQPSIQEVSVPGKLVYHGVSNDGLPASLPRPSAPAWVEPAPVFSSLPASLPGAVDAVSRNGKKPAHAKAKP